MALGKSYESFLCAMPYKLNDFLKSKLMAGISCPLPFGASRTGELTERVSPAAIHSPFRISAQHAVFYPVGTFLSRIYFNPLFQSRCQDSLSPAAFGGFCHSSGGFPHRFQRPNLA
jgi:hypothetical protein